LKPFASAVTVASPNCISEFLGGGKLLHQIKRRHSVQYVLSDLADQAEVSEVGVLHGDNSEDRVKMPKKVVIVWSKK
jgi:hypothetical protein